VDERRIGGEKGKGIWKRGRKKVNDVGKGFGEREVRGFAKGMIEIDRHSKAMNFSENEIFVLCGEGDFKMEVGKEKVVRMDEGIKN
jgi:hypothetical protein